MCQSSQKLIGFRFALKANLQTIGVAAAAVAASIAGAQEAGNGDASAPKARTAPTTAQVSIPRDATERMKWDILPILKACQVEATSDKERIVIPWNGKNRAGLVRFVQVLNKREAYLILNMYCSAITTASSDKSQADAHYRREIRVANGRDADVEVYCDRSRVDLSRYSQRFQRPPGAGTGERLTLHGFMDRSPQRRAKVPKRNPIRRPDNEDGLRHIGNSIPILTFGGNWMNLMES